MTIEEVLREFVRDIEDAGGIVSIGHRFVPFGSLDWSDLAVTYIHACTVLGREPKKDVSEDEDDEEVKDEDDEDEEVAHEPQDEDLVTSDRWTFYRAGMNKVAFVVPADEDWQPYAKAYMDKQQFWPDVWLEGERGGYTNITTEQP